MWNLSKIVRREALIKSDMSHLDFHRTNQEGIGKLTWKGVHLANYKLSANMQIRKEVMFFFSLAAKSKKASRKWFWWQNLLQAAIHAKSYLHRVGHMVSVDGSISFAV